MHYQNQFKGKIVLCNCDDPFESNFCYYFLRHFNQLHFKKLICTSYAGSKIGQIKENIQLSLDLYDRANNPVLLGKGHVLSVSQMPRKSGEETSG